MRGFKSTTMILVIIFLILFNVFLYIEKDYLMLKFSPKKSENPKKTEMSNFEKELKANIKENTMLKGYIKKQNNDFMLMNLKVTSKIDLMKYVDKYCDITGDLNMDTQTLDISKIDEIKINNTLGNAKGILNKKSISQNNSQNKEVASSDSHYIIGDIEIRSNFDLNQYVGKKVSVEGNMNSFGSKEYSKTLTITDSLKIVEEK